MAAKKKKRRRNRGGQSTRSSPSVERSTRPTQPSPARRERKEQARAAREAARKRAARTAALRRAALISGVGLGVFAVLWWTQRAAAPKPLPRSAVQAINAAGCRYDSSPADSAPGNQHLAAGQATTYPSVPGTSGFHDPSPIQAGVYTEPVQETQAVHFMEHSGIVVYYRADGKNAVPQPVVDRLTTFANDTKNTVLAPYRGLPDDTSLSVTAWNKVADCGPDVSPDQAASIAGGFVEAFSCNGNAPEPQNGDC